MIGLRVVTTGLLLNPLLLASATCSILFIYFIHFHSYMYYLDEVGLLKRKLLRKY